MQQNTFILYANATSLFDNTNGASKSIKLLLESLANKGCKVFAIMGCTSDSHQGFKTNQRIWFDHSSGREIGHKTKSFKCKGVNYLLIATEHWSRKYLAADEQEEIYRHSQRTIVTVANNYSRKLFIGWGNLLLEEAIFKAAKDNNFKLIFYLANPTYQGKGTRTLQISNQIITDSMATKKLYLKDFGLPEIQVLPKCVEKPERVKEAAERWNDKTILFVNPKLKKGLEALLIIAAKLTREYSGLKIKIVDTSDQLSKGLKLLGINQSDLPKNILIEDGHSNADDLLENITIVLLLSLWHESGSRLIYESHLRGIPALVFNTGGSAELIGDAVEDIFERPVTTDNNGQPKILNWNPEKMVNRIIELTSNVNTYAKHSQLLRKRTSRLMTNNSTAAEIILKSIQ